MDQLATAYKDTIEPAANSAFSDASMWLDGFIDETENFLGDSLNI